MLGHFSAGFTLDTYAHVTTSAQKEAAQTMEMCLRFDPQKKDTALSYDRAVLLCIIGTIPLERGQCSRKNIALGIIKTYT